MYRRLRVLAALLTGLLLLSACARAEEGAAESAAVSVTAQTAARQTDGTAYTAPSASVSSASRPRQTERYTTAPAVRQAYTSTALQRTTAVTTATVHTAASSARPSSAAVWTENSLQTADGFLLRYYLYTPSDAAANMPLIVYLHGGSGKGDDLSVLLSLDGFPRYLYTGELGDVRAFVAVPQLPAEKKGWADVASALYALTEKLAAECRIDRTRMALTGHSMGGTGSWSVALRYPAVFARVAPLSGSVRYTAESAAALKNTEIWAFVGDADTIVPPESSRAFVEALQKSGGSARLTAFADADHFSVPALAYLSGDRALLQFLTFS